MKGNGLGINYYSGIFMEGLRKTKKDLSQYNLFLDRDSKSRSPEYEAGVLTLKT